MGKYGRSLDLATLILVLLVGSAVAVLGLRDRGPAEARPGGAGPIWIQYLEAGLDAGDALWSHGAEESRAALARGDFGEAEKAARRALASARSFGPGDPRRAAAEELLARSLEAQGRRSQLSAR